MVRRAAPRRRQSPARCFRRGVTPPPQSRARSDPDSSASSSAAGWFAAPRPRQSPTVRRAASLRGTRRASPPRAWPRSRAAPRLGYSSPPAPPPGDPRSVSSADLAALPCCSLTTAGAPRLLRRPCWVPVLLSDGTSSSDTGWAAARRLRGDCCGPSSRRLPLRRPWRHRALGHFARRRRASSLSSTREFFFPTSHQVHPNSSHPHPNSSSCVD